MNTIKIKSKISTIALLTLLAVSVFAVALPTQVQAAKNTFPVISFASNPTGVNQELLIVYGITDATTWPQPGWSGLTLTIERPDGDVETFEDLNTDTTGLSAMIYVPPIVGNYYVTLYFPEQELEYATLGLPAGTMLASQTDRRELVVVDVQQEYHPGFNLPEEYWTRPIDSQLREWSRITGNWLEVHENVGNRYAPNNEYAPETAHILWARPLSKGGLAGGAQGHHGYSEGDAYEGLYQNDIIIGGKLYYNLLNTRTQGVLPPESQEVVAVDLHTGEVDWQKPLQTPDGSIRNLAFGQQMFWDAFNHHAVYSYLWSTAGSTWHAFDPFTGDWSYSIENVPSGTRVHGPNGELLVYTINIDGGWMSLWNNVKTVNPQDYGNSNDGSWGRNIGLDAEYSDRVYDAERGMVWNVSIPDLPPLSAFYSTLIMEDRIIGSNTGNIFGGPQTDPEFWALSLQPGHEGTLMWREPWTPPVADLWVHFTPNFQPSLEDGVFIVQAKETGQNWGFDIDSGEEIWGPTDPLPDIATATNLYFPRWGQAVGSDGIVVLGGGMGGVLRGHEIATGKELWEYEFPDEYKEILWSTNWPAVPQFVADGKVYVAHQEHSPLDPKPRGAPFVVLDLETGTEVFTADGMFRSTRWGGQAIIGDSIMAAMDTYDQRVYAVGRGPSAIAVEKPQAVAEMGSAVTIQGTVMDVSPGTQDAATKLRFPYGVPTVSDAGQSEWMLYVYKNYERPMDAIGVTVKVEVIAPSGNPESMDATSDSYGNWALGFCPEETGTYTIVATFEGSKAYYGSTQTTYLTVAEPVGGADTSDLEDSVNSVDESVTNLTTYVMAILVLVIIALLIAIYVLLRK